MDTRAITRTRLSIIPVLIALMFNLVVPVLTVAVPQVTPTALRPQVAEAASDPNHVAFTLEGCRLENGAFIEATVTCEDAAYTSGNLGKEWNELDLVPHRLTTTLGSQSDATTTYTFGIAADREDGGAPGYDVMSAPVVNAALSDDSCQVTAGAETIIEPGVGGTDKSIGRLVTITQDKGTTCVIDWYERLALGSHLFPGSSLHTNRTNQQFSTSGIGAADVSIPVNEILPQELSKTMAAEVGQTYTWDVAKSANPTSLNFANTCLDTAGSRSQSVQITVSWTRSGPTASGATTITTEVTAINPAHRTITVQATDKIYAGADQSNLLDTKVGNAVDVPANTSMVVLSHSFVYNGSATTFNDVATATYTDKLTGIPVPGATSATASATAQPAGGTPAQASVLVSDTESITGNGLAFSVAAPSVGAFTGGYVAGTSTTGPVGWQFTATNSGSVTFTKTVTVDEPRITSGTLSDTATITGDGQSVLDTASASVDITTDALVALDINKTIPSGSLRSGESVTFNFEISGPNSSSDTASITFDFGDPLTKSTSLSGLAPGQYTVHEVPQPNWADHVDQVDTITLPDCDGSVSFNNSTLAPDLDLSKTADDESVTAGDPIGFEITLTNSGATGTGIAKDAVLNDALPFGDGIDWEIDAVTGIGGFDPTGLCSITGSPPDEDLNCDLGDLAPGEGVTVAISSDTTGDSCGVYTNTAKASATNHEEITSTDSTDVLCPDLEIEKTTSTPEINAGQEASYTVTISNLTGDAPATGVDLVDQLPSGLTWTDDSDDCTVSAGGLLECLDLTIPAGEEFSVTVTGMTDEGECPSILNRATFTSENGGSGASHPEGQGATITVNCPDLEVTKEQVDANGDPTDEPVDAGLTAYFAIHVTNHGPGTAFDVDVLDFAPNGTVWTVVDDGGFDCPATIDDAGDSCTADSMVPGTATIIVSYLTSEADCGTLVNNVEVSASNEPAAVIGADNEASADITVECPGLNHTKVADATPIDAGEEASFTIRLWNTGPGDALDVELHDDLPAGLTWDFEIVNNPASAEDCAIASSLGQGGEVQMSIDCEFGTLGVTTEATGIVIRVFADTDRTDCGVLLNSSEASASNFAEPLIRQASIEVKCPTIELDKENDADGPVLPGTTVGYTLTVTVDDGPAKDVEVVDELPDGIVNPSNISDGGVYDSVEHAITWTLGDLGDGTYILTYDAVVADDVENGAELVNVAGATSPNSQCPDLETLGPECEDDSTVIVRVPSLVIDKVADTEVITISGPANAPVASPSVVTWTLTYTLANGPVTNAVISDPVPDGFEFLDASDGGQLVNGEVVWTFATLSESGSVTFRTTVDPETIDRVDPTVNVATISSDETPEDDGEDSVRVVVVPPPLGGNPTPKPSLPNTALGVGPDGQPVSVPFELLVAFFVGSLGALTLANVRARGGRRR
ncbi:MAG TPA: hypothetical protein VFW95_05005 [Candidatus Limnocylindria bacterium]|nr:hypothetical protein [Candidatus Limnocylindria bacterium]